MIISLDNSWREVLKTEFDKPYFEKLIQFIEAEYAEKEIYPPRKDIFKAFELCPFNQTKLVILGQDPYHGYAQANGLCFSVNDGVAVPPSLRNIFKEISSDLNCELPLSADLSRWARQGVLLLNATLTVEANRAASHQRKGWEEFTDAVIRVLAEQKEQIVFLLWGNYAQQKGSFIDPNRHLVLKSVHPSPLSAHRGFFGNKHFSLSNEYLRKNAKSEIEW